MFTRKNIFLVFLFVVISCPSFSQNFVTTWTTTSASETITIPTTGSGYSYNVNWGVGEPIDATTYTGNASHTYASSGTYTVTITGTFRRIYFNNTGDKDKIQSIEEWGSNHSWTSMSRAFEGCTNLVNNASDTPDLSSCTTLTRMFYKASSIGGATETGNWAWTITPSSITNLSQMFREATVFNKDISGWNTTNITNMSHLFRDANAFNQDISSWVTSSVSNMTTMFRNATAFNQDISGWTTSAVTTMSNMFRGATVFNQNIGGWIVTSVNNMDNMFYGANAFNQDLNSWIVSSVTNMSDMFRETAFNGDISSWTTTSVTNMSNMFRDATAFNQDISGWTTPLVANISVMFRGATAFNQDISGWNISAATNTSQMFYDAIAFNQDISGWNTNLVNTMSNMFRGAAAFNQDIGGWNTANVTNMNNMFRGATAFDQDISGWNVALVTNFGSMLRNVTLSPANYNALLIGWNAQSLQPGEAFHGGNSKYCSAAAIAAKANMISSDGWSFNDGGELTSFTWSGSTDTDWNDPSNWQDGYTPDCSIDISIPSVTNHPIIDASSEVTVDNLTINSGAILTIEGGLTVGGNLTTNNGLTINSGGSIIVNGTSTGNLTYNRNIPIAKKWYYVSPPVEGEDIEDYISNNSLDTGNGNVGLFYYDNDDTILSYAGTGYVFYTPTSTGGFTSGKGYGTKLSSASDVVFTGTMPIGDKSISVTTGGSIDDSNLIGNPYPSYLPTSDLLITNTSLLSEQTIWLWDNTANDYVTYNQLSSHFIPPGQGFFVDVSTGGTFSFLESWQEHQTTDVFYKGSNSIFEINLKISNTNNEQKTTQIYYFEDKTVDFDNGYDSSSFSDESETFLLSTRLVGNHDSQNLAIQTLPSENLQNYVIPLFVKGSGELNLSIDTANKPNDILIYIEDKELNTFTLLQSNLSYKINSSGNTNGIGRYYLHTQNKSLKIDKELLNKISIYTTKNKTLNISGLPSEKTEFTLYNILGKQLLNESFIADNSTKKVTLLSLKKGIYILNLETKEGVISKKIIIE